MCLIFTLKGAAIRNFVANQSPVLQPIRHQSIQKSSRTVPEKSYNNLIHEGIYSSLPMFLIMLKIA